MPTTTNPAGRWRTYAPLRRVLAVVHNVTAATRLLDVVSLVAEDSRLELAFTDPGSSAFPAGTTEFLASHDVRLLPWQDAVASDFDLAIAASHGPNLHELTAPLVIVPHGMGYNKYLETGNRKPETGNRKPETGNRKPVFGLSDDWLLHGDRVIPTVLTLSHEEQLLRLKRDSPAAVSRARVVGDLVFDQLVASRPRRDTYRKALGVNETETLVLLSSTWGEDSLLGAAPDLPAALGIALPADEFRLAMAVHPNVWWGHSPWQIRQWLAACARAGVTVLEHVDDWRAAAVAADVVVGDHGSVSFYAAALGTPVVLATAPEHAVAPDSPIGMFLGRAPRLAGHTDLAGRLRTVLTGHNADELADVTSLVTSLPDQAAPALRAVLYELLNLPEPTRAAHTQLLPTPRQTLRRCESHLVEVDRAGPAEARLIRYPAEGLHTEHTAGGRQLVVGPHEPSRRWHELADIVVGETVDATPEQLAKALAQAPGALLATAPTGNGEWLLCDERGVCRKVTTAGDLFASVALHALAAGQRLDELDGDWTFTVGNAVITATVTDFAAGHPRRVR